MGKYRDDVNERQIRFNLLQGKTVEATAMKYGCSESLVRAIRNGTRKAPPVNATKAVIPADNLCCCCNERAIAPGNRFLCAVCFRCGDVGTIC